MTTAPSKFRGDRVLRSLARDISRTDCLPKESMTDLAATRPQKTLRAPLRPLLPPEQKLVEANLRLVPFVGRQYQFDRKPHYADLIQEGMIGLIAAAELWDPSKGSFSTYAFVAIFGHMLRAHDEIIYFRGMSIGTSVQARIGRLNRLRSKLGHKFGRRPTNQELFEASGCTRVQFENAVTAPSAISLEHSPRFRSYTMVSDGLAEEHRDYRNNRMSEILVDPTSMTDGRAIESELIDVFRFVLATLTPREERVLRLRFGLEQDEDQTLEEVGMTLRLTAVRIRQIEAKALRKLRHHSRAKRLRPFMD